MASSVRESMRAKPQSYAERWHLPYIQQAVPMPGMVSSEPAEDRTGMILAST